ncbi:cytochrome-c oxidase, cbb3-type subunit III [Halofilum ochraceum]|uniref:cytochrome-c oxidase, cbb3-type subunit III n=1 Tax=Halofilum ochraceum TaxID=1611323 RepID=UPI00082E1A91|nr:cytochrome-c oxidase, cbb3-type subunit III [Halofilum ochraceum]
MSAFWSGWIIFFVTLNWLLVTFLLIYGTRVPIPTYRDGTTGHVWAHGAIREGVRRLPMWWVVLSLVVIVFGTVYLFRYPGFGAFGGTQEWTSEERVQRHMAENEERLSLLFDRVRTESVDTLARDPQVIHAGQVLYEDNCAACHGANAGGNQVIGAPNLVDDAWLYGDSVEAIHTSLTKGRQGQMPALGSALGERGTRAVAAYVYEMNGRDWPREDLVAEGEELYASQCVACHGPEGKGKTAMGAPDLTDDSWLYGGRLEDIITSIRDGRSGVMPGWSERLREEEIRILTAWVRAGGPAQDTGGSSDTE